MSPASLVQLLDRLRPVLPVPGQVWVVGGAVRDDLLGREILDLDFAVQGDARRLSRAVADKLSAKYYELDRERDAGRVVFPPGDYPPRTLDFAALRGASIEQDLASRDFTVNAMARGLAAPEDLLDPLGGLHDLREGILRACSPHAVWDDPLRALRAVRLASAFGLRIEPETLEQVRAAGARLPSVTAERLRDELMRVLDEPHPAGAIRVLDHLGLLTVVLPEIEPLRGLKQPPPHEFSALDHTLAVTDRLGDVLGVLDETAHAEAAADIVLGELSLRLGRYRVALAEHLNRSLSYGRRDRQLLFLATLLHDVGKPSTAGIGPSGKIRFLGHEVTGAEIARERGRALRLSADEIAHIGGIIAHHLRPESLSMAGTVTDRAVYRFFRDTGEAGIDVIVLSLADFLGKSAPPPVGAEWSARLDVARRLLDARFGAPPERLNPPRLIRGDRLAKVLGIEPGPEVGRLLEAIREAQTAGEVFDEAGAIELARRLLAG